MARKVKNQHRLKTKEVRELLGTLRSQYPTELFSENAVVDTGTLEEYSVLIVDGDIDFFLWQGRYLMTLVGVAKYQVMARSVTVDMGAIRFITNGADVMAPGVVDADPSIHEGDEVWVRDVTHKKPLAVGIALVSGESMAVTKAGKAVKTVHYVGDPLWVLTHD